MTTAVYKPEGKDIMTPIKYTLMVYSPNGKKTWFYERLIFEDKKNTA